MSRREKQAKRRKVYLEARDAELRFNVRTMFNEAGRMRQVSKSWRRRI